jgi:hypothetical protein
MPGKLRGLLVLLFLLLLSVSFSTPVRAEVKSGEIININYKYKVAFTDLTQSDLQTGDRVAVKDTEGKTVYLVAAEVYPVMVKLSVPAEQGYTLSDEQFAKIVVGSPVIVTYQSAVETRSAVASRPAPAPQASSGVTSGPGQAHINWKGSATLTTSHNSFAPVTQPPAKKGVGRQKGPVMYDPGKITVRTETVSDTDAPSAPQPVVAPASVLTQFSAPVPAQLPSVKTAVDMESKVAMLEQKVDKLVDSNLSMADQITKFLREKSALEQLLREKDAALDLSRKQVMSLSKGNAPQEEEFKRLQGQIAGLKEEKAAADQEIKGLNEKIAELKKKLERMVELVNKYMKKYE